MPDIHACFRTLVKLISQLNPDPQEDLLIFLGDYINKGPAPIKTLSFLKQISTHYKVEFLLGNHEELLINYWDTNNEESKKNLISMGSSALLPLREEYYSFLSQMYHYLESETAFLVHAGFNFRSENPFTDVLGMLAIKFFDYDEQQAKGKKIIRGHFPLPLSEVRKSLSQNILSLDNGCVYPSREGQGNLVAYDLKKKELKIQPNQDGQVYT